MVINAQPATISTRLNEVVFSAFQNASHFVDANDELIIGLPIEIEKLSKVDVCEASLLKARLAVLMGDRHQAEYWLKNAAQNNADSDNHDLAKMTMLVGLGYMSEALPLLRRCMEPQRNLQNHFFDLLPPIGAFHFLETSYRAARELKLSNLRQTPPFDPGVVQIMNAWGDTDEDYAAALDVAGKVLRDHKMFSGANDFFATPILHPIDDSPSYVMISFTVDVDLEAAVDLTCEYLTNLAASKIKIPSSMVLEFNAR